MGNLTITPASVAPVRIIEQDTAPTGEAINAGQYCRLDTSTGKFVLGNGTTAAEARSGGIALNSVASGETLTVLKKGEVDLGDALDSLTYDDDVFLSDTDGTLADSAGTVSKIVGTVVTGYANSTPDKLLRVNL